MVSLLDRRKPSTRHVSDRDEDMATRSGHDDRTDDQGPELRGSVPEARASNDARQQEC